MRLLQSQRRLRPDRPAAPPIRPRTASRSVTDEGLKGFRDVIAEAEALGDATAQGAKTAREAFAATPPTGSGAERLEPRVEPEGLRTPARPPSRPVEPPARAPAVSANPFETTVRPSRASLSRTVRSSRGRGSSGRARCDSRPPTTSANCPSIRASAWLPPS